jgi:integrase
LHLTELNIKNLGASGKLVRIFDGMGEGLYLEVSPKGLKTWRIKLCHHGKNTSKSLGHWPKISLKRAREMAVEMNQSRTKNGVFSLKMTFEELAAEWVHKFTPKYTPKEIQRKKFFLTNYINPKLGREKVDKITPLMILELVLRPLEKRGILETAHKVKSLINLIFRYGFASGQVERNPVSDLTGALPSTVSVPRAAILIPEKIGRLLNNMQEYTGAASVYYALNILPYVFVRPGELRNATWDEINFAEKIWRIPANRMKMQSAHLVPLADQVIRLLTELREHTGKNKYLFPGARTFTKPISDVTINAALRYLGYEKHEITGHGFREMAAKLLSEKGFNCDWIEKQLAHSERNRVRAAPNRGDFLKERTAMMQAWADYLDKLKEDAKPQP